jgi:hypothetical protein
MRGAQLGLFGASDYCQRWRARRASWRHVSDGGFDRRLYDVAPIGRELARGFIDTHHYLGTLPANRFSFGLWRGPSLEGVAVLSIPSNVRTLTGVFPELVPYAESLELGRFCLLDAVPANAESWFLAQVWRQAGAEGVRGVVSFSDPVARTSTDGRVTHVGHYGALYQASNATYTGRSGARTLRLLADGRIVSPRSLAKYRNGERSSEYVAPLLVANGARPRFDGETAGAWLDRVLPAITRPLRHTGNHRYAFALGRHVKLGPVALPYPKGIA